MKNTLLYDLILLVVLFIGNIIIGNSNNYFILIYSILFIYNIYIIYLVIKNYSKNIIKIILISLILYPITYFFICDPNPIFSLLTYYIFFPNFFKAIIIVLIHTFFLSNYPIKKKNNFNKKIETKPLKAEIIMYFQKYKKSYHNRFYFLSFFVKYFQKDKTLFIIFLLSLILILTINVFLFLKRIKLWVYFNDKKRTLPLSYSNNTTFYITALVANMDKIIINYIEQMKQLIKYLGKENIIVSIVENGDSKDKTREFLEEFQNYLNENKIINKFILKHVIDDPRMKIFPFEKFSPLRIKFYSELRNKCFDLLYELPNIDFDNTKIIYFNDIFFEYEDIINLIATNNEDYDAVCGLDFYDTFYDRWVSNDLDGNSFTYHFPYFINKEAQDLVLNHKPVRVFSCWNGVIVFKAKPLKDKKIQFRFKIDNKRPKYIINNSASNDYESECTYFHIDLFTLGYTKKLINPDVRVAYESKYFYKRKYFYPSLEEIKSYFYLYFQSFKFKRNKLMSNYKLKNIKFNKMVENWYLENKRSDLL